MQIYGPTQLHGPQSISAPHSARATTPASSTGSAAVSDQLDISSTGQLLDKISQMPDIRQDRVTQLRTAIAQGTYETDDKLSSALNGLLDEIG